MLDDGLWRWPAEDHKCEPSEGLLWRAVSFVTHSSLNLEEWTQDPGVVYTDPLVPERWVRADSLDREGIRTNEELPGSQASWEGHLRIHRQR